jgi:hypothetical protein
LRSGYASLAGVSATSIIGAAITVAHAATCTIPDQSVHYNMADGRKLVVSYINQVILDTSIIELNGSLSATQTNTTYGLASGGSIHIGVNRANVQFIGNTAVDGGWGQLGEPWIQYGDGGIQYINNQAVATGSFVTASSLFVSFSDANGTIRAYTSQGGNVVPLADGQYVLSGNDTFTVSSGVVVAGQANFLCYASSH